ncbi:unnamed protein product, partial [Brassica rapa]
RFLLVGQDPVGSFSGSRLSDDHDYESDDDDDEEEEYKGSKEIVNINGDDGEKGEDDDGRFGFCDDDGSCGRI